MKVLGNKFREARKRKRLSQTALAAGICTQATVSKIENKNRCESLDIFYSLCTKLGILVEEYLVENEEQELTKILDDVEYLCNINKCKEAFELLECYGDKDIVNLSNDLAVRYLYYKGRTSSNGMSYYKQGLAYLNQAKSLSKKTSIYSLLIENAIAATYMLNGEGLKKAQLHFERINQMLQEFSEELLPPIICGLYYNLAKYFSELKEYQKSIDLCNAGIRINKRTNSNVYLVFLLYEKAYNEFYLYGTEEGYRIAYYMSEFINHEYILGCIKKDMNKYNIEL